MIDDRSVLFWCLPLGHAQQNSSSVEERLYWSKRWAEHRCAEWCRWQVSIFSSIVDNNERSFHKLRAHPWRVLHPNNRVDYWNENNENQIKVHQLIRLYFFPKKFSRNNNRSVMTSIRAINLSCSFLRKSFLNFGLRCTLPQKIS